MTEIAPQSNCLPSCHEIRRAVEIYLEQAYGLEIPPRAGAFLPPCDIDPAQWLMSDITERDPSHAPLQAVRSFALRIGNAVYPHMKLRLSRPPKDPVFLFTVDSHDAILSAPAATPDYVLIEELKRHNAELANRIAAAWDHEGLPTERNYLRQKIRQAKLDAQEGDTIIG